MVSVAVFCPQSKAPQESYLNQIHSYLTQNQYLKELLLPEILGLKDTWSTFANARQDIAALTQGPRYMQNLSDWITTGKSSCVTNTMSGILSLPLLAIIQITQYFQYLDLYRITHVEFLDQLRKGGGFQGYCGGLPPAIAVACSTSEADVAKNAGIALRLALAIGAYGELGDDESIPGATTIVVRVKREGQGEELVRKFAGVRAISKSRTLPFLIAQVRSLNL